MLTKDSLPSIPPHQMKEFMQAAENIDKELAGQDTQVADLMDQLAPPPEESAPEPTPAPVQQQSQPEPSSEAKANWRAMRSENEELKRQIREIQQAQQAAKKTRVRRGPNDLLEGQDKEEITQDIDDLRAENQRQLQEINQRLLEAQLRAKHPDLDSVLSKDNLEELRRLHPHLAEVISVAATKDAYNAATAAYSIIRDMGIDKSTKESSMTKRLIQENASKPRSAQSASPQRGQTPLSRANEYMYDGKMTDELQNQLLKEMQEARMKPRS